jgi:tetratricopeptide (TPR) repeat protein
MLAGTGLEIAVPSKVKISPARSRLPDTLVCVALVAATWILYASVFHNNFVNFDDDKYVTANQQVLSGLSWSNAWWALTTTHAANWHPMTWLSLQLDSQWYAPTGRETPSATGYLRTNLLLHTASTVLLFVVLRRMTGSVGRSALVAAFFAVHPFHVESVAWVAERKDVLSGLFFMLTLLAYVHYVERPTGRRYLLVVLALAFGLAAKPMLVTLPCVLLLLDYWPLGRFPSIREKLPLFALAALASAMTWYAQQHGHAMNDTTLLPLSTRLANGLVSYCTYLGKTFWPTNLAVFYPYPKTGFSPWQVAGAGVFLALATAFAVGMRKRWPYVTVGWFWYVGTLVPVIGLVQVGGQAMADRYTYLPLIGIFLLAVWGVYDLAVRWQLQKLAVPVAGLVLVIWSLYTWAQVHYWHDSVALWEHALHVTADNSRARVNLGMAYVERNNLGAAIPQFKEAVRIDPQDVFAHLDLGAALVRQGKPDEALEYLQLLLTLSPDNPQAHINLGTAYEMMGRSAEAIEHYAEAARLGPANALLLLKWGIALEDRGDPGAAIGHYRDALALAPDDALALQCLGFALARRQEWAEAAVLLRRAAELDTRNVKVRCTLAYCLFHLGKLQAAREQYQEATKLDPDWLQQANAKAWTRATNPESRTRDGRSALELAQQVCQATEHTVPQFLDTLAAAYAEVGNFDQAVATARQALSLASANGPSAFRKALEGRVAAYLAKQPFRSADNTPNS